MKIILMGKPIAKKRPRFSTRSGFVVTYDPQEVEKNDVKAKFIEVLNEKLDSENKSVSMEASSISTATAYKVIFNFYMPICQSENSSVKNLKSWGLKFHTTKPDYDNLEKFYLDCANGIFWKDDAMIIESQSFKRYDENPRVEIEIMAKKELSFNEKIEKFYSTFSKEKMKEFIDDIKSISKTNFDELLIENDNLSESSLVKFAEILSDFSCKHCDTIKKIEKIGNIEVDCTTLTKEIQSINLNELRI